jgi:signal transduction histidine kinase
MKKIKTPFELKISILYVIFGALWILFSDGLVLQITHDPYKIQTISIYKGWFYVLITGILLYILVKNEIKKRAELYQKLLDANRKATESDQLKTAFLSNISHYIRTPMNSILGFVELLESRNLDDEKRIQFHRIINEQSSQLLELIGNIIEISKIHTGQIEIKNQSFAINQSLNQLFYYSQLLIDELNKPIAIKAICGLNDVDLLNSDEDKIKHILKELLSNAIKYTMKGEIEFGYINNKDHLIFYVKDTGPGISENIKKHLFNSFMFPVNTELILPKGSGLGLYMSAGLVKLLGGTLWLEYTGPNGSKFCFSIPNK